MPTVIGLFNSATDAALTLDNLAEADFPSSGISLVMKTRQEVEDLANVSGPLTGLSPEELRQRLIALGVTPEDAAAYKDGVLGGGVFIAIAAGSAAPAAAEMLKDGEAREIHVLKDGQQEEPR